ncbi:MAG: esterase [bacterium]
MNDINLPYIADYYFSRRSMINELKSALFSKRSWRSLGEYVGLGKRGRAAAMVDLSTTRKFIETRASHVSQSTLYGYLKTRAGTRFPELFENPRMLESINIAKWQIWLACISDLTVYIGAFISRDSGLSNEKTRQLMQQIANAVLDDIGVPEEAGVEFESARNDYLARILEIDWGSIPDDETAFSVSPDALVKWSPIADELKQRDEEIVENSMRFRWIEVRRNVRELLDAPRIVRNTLDT